MVFQLLKNLVENEREKHSVRKQANNNNKKKTESTICPKQITLTVFLFFYSSQGSYASSCMESQL